MKITYRDKSYWIVWKHDLPIREHTVISTRSTKKVDAKPGKTTCFIYDDTKQGEPFIIAESSVGCDSRDNYNKETGRQLSLIRAMEFADLDKNMRRDFWNQYNNSKPGGRW